MNTLFEDCRMEKANGVEYPVVDAGCTSLLTIVGDVIMQ